MVGENDLELLEAMLDDELSADEVRQLRERLAAEPELAGALDELRSERAERAAAWRSMEPSPAAADQFAWRVASAARRQELRSRAWRVGRFASAAAACVLVGFFAGWLGRDGGNGQFVGSGSGVPGTLVMTDPSGKPQPGASRLPLAFRGEQRAPGGVLISEIQYHDSAGRIIPMLIVRDVTPGSPAAAVLQEGDLLVSLDGQPLKDIPTLVAGFTDRPGARRLRVLRNNVPLDVTLQVQSAQTRLREK